METIRHGLSAVRSALMLTVVLSNFKMNLIEIESAVVSIKLKVLDK